MISNAEEFIAAVKRWIEVQEGRTKGTTRSSHLG